MASHTSIRAGLVVALTLAAGIVTDAQMNWPSARSAKVATTTAKSAKARKPAPVKRRRISKPAAAVATAREADLLRAMAELVTRQAAAIEALARRLEAAEARLEVLASAAGPEAPVVAELDQAQAPFRAALSIDWSELLAR